MPSFDERRLLEALRHEKTLRGLAATLLRDPADVDDAVEHTLLQEARGHRREPEVWPFLRTTLRNRAATLLKLALRRRRHEGAAAETGAAPAVDELLAREQLRRRVADAVLGLPEPYRTTIWLRWFEGSTSVAIAHHQGIPVATVRTRLQRAYAMLRQRLTVDHGDRCLALLGTLPLRAMPASPALLVALLMTKKLLATAMAVVLLGGAAFLPWWAGAERTGASSTRRRGADGSCSGPRSTCPSGRRTTQ
jgi:RNA polymerase sigma factor (sigma-70 family)